ncbi:MAG: BMP family ABC transporter substrate-binding protein [Patescibacteria group bacterium]
MRRKVFRAVFLIGIVLMAAVVCGQAAAPKLIVGILHVGSVTDAGYNQAHHEGVTVMKKNLPWVKVISAEKIPEGAEAERVMENMIQRGAKLIIPASYGYMDPALNVAKRHPNVFFEHPGGYKLAPNMGVYWADTTGAFYLMGIAAGLTTKTNKLGFVCAMPIAFLLGNINAFQLGAKSVNPQVTTRVVFTGGWVDPAKEAMAANALIDEGVDTVGAIVDSPISVVKTAEKRGVFSVGYHYVGVRKFAPKGWISGVAFSWGELYTKFAKQVVEGTWKSQNINGNLGDDFLVIAPFGPAVPTKAEDLVNQKKKELIQGKFHVFQGPLKDNQGVERVPAGKAYPLWELYKLDWLVEGVIGQAK